MNNNQKSVFEAHPEIYDKMIDWDTRLVKELPFLKKILKANKVKTALDLGCGPGHHACALSKAGFKTMGIDLSPAMIDYAKTRAKSAKCSTQFRQGSFTNFNRLLTKPVNAVLSLGNAYASIPDKKELFKAFQEVRRALTPDGTFFFQILNYTRILKRGSHDLPPKSFQLDGDTIFFLRHFEIIKKTVQMNVVVLHGKGSEWTQEFHVHNQLFLSHHLILRCLTRAGFKSIEYFGDLTGSPYGRYSSPDLVVVARR